MTSFPVSFTNLSSDDYSKMNQTKLQNVPLLESKWNFIWISVFLILLLVILLKKHRCKIIPIFFFINSFLLWMIYPRCVIPSTCPGSTISEGVSISKSSTINVSIINQYAIVFLKILFWNLFFTFLHLKVSSLIKKTSIHFVVIQFAFLFCMVYFHTVFIMGVFSSILIPWSLCISFPIFILHHKKIPADFTSNSNDENRASAASNSNRISAASNFNMNNRNDRTSAASNSMNYRASTDNNNNNNRTSAGNNMNNNIKEKIRLQVLENQHCSELLKYLEMARSTKLLVMKLKRLKNEDFSEEIESFNRLTGEISRLKMQMIGYLSSDDLSY